MRSITFIFVLLFFTGFVSGQNVLSKPTIKDSLNYCGDNQVVTSGQHLFKTIKVLVSEKGNPVSGVSVELKVLLSPDINNKGIVSPATIITNNNGIAEFNYLPAEESGDYLLAASLTNDTNSGILAYKATVRNNYWAWWVVFGLLGGLGLFLFGINYLSDGLQRAAGNKLRTILSNLTQNRLAGLGIGSFITTVIQSSSAMSVMLISFVDSGLMKFRQTVPVIIGSAIGTTLTIQLVALNISKYALAFVAVGFILNFFAKRHYFKHLGQIITGLGLLFLGLMLMSESIAPLKTFQPVIDALLEMENPLIGVLAGIIFTAITQSASAFIGIVIILGSQGLLSLEASIPLLIGANVGTSVTAIIAAVGVSTEAKKVAVAHTVYRIIGAGLIVWWIPAFAEIVRSVSVSEATAGVSVAIPRQIANSHTLFYLGLTIISLPLTSLFAKFIDKLVPTKKTDTQTFLSVQFIDDNLLSTPPLALNLAKQETIRMAHIVQDMVNDVLLPFLLNEGNVIPEVEKNEKQVDYLRDIISEYLVKISRLNVHEENTNEAFQMLSVVKELEQMADIVAVNLLSKAKEWVVCGHSLSDEGKKEIVDFHNRCQKQLSRAIEVFRDVNLEKAKVINRKGKKYSDLAIELEKSHFLRLAGEVRQSVDSSRFHMELLGMFNAINRHASNIARILLKGIN
ncbi:MAG: Na/Pi symporter [Bacteroidia bacterium]|nr:Na/Pi symporter [Bacteroidia bacterium]